MDGSYMLMELMMRSMWVAALGRRAAFRLVPLALGAAVLGGCASGPREYSISGTADAVINRDSNGNSLSVVVYTYQLKDKNEFVRLTFDAVASGRTDSELFPQELLGRAELVLVPGARQVAVDTLLPETRYLGVVGLFRKPDAQYWRFLVDADAVRRSGLNFAVEDCYLKLLRPKPVPMPGQPAGHVPQCGVNPPQARSSR